jgi:hypothetical protein
VFLALSGVLALALTPEEVEVEVDVDIDSDVDSDVDPSDAAIAAIRCSSAIWAVRISSICSMCPGRSGDMPPFAPGPVPF